MKRLLAIFVLPLVIIIAIFAFLTWRTISSPWPTTEGELSLPGLQDTVTVIRDPRGIPHIYASNPHDLFMAQGFVHAQDRFWQMEFWRRIGAGRLSEIFGESQVDTDRFLRTLGALYLRLSKPGRRWMKTARPRWRPTPKASMPTSPKTRTTCP